MRVVQIFLILTLLGILNLTAQDKIIEFPVKNIEGTTIGNNNETIDQIVNRAINNAKIEALKSVGVEENILSYTDYFKSETNSTYDELFTSDLLSDIRGAVKNVEVYDTLKTFNEFGNLSVNVKINCVVIKYLTQRDLLFSSKVSGIKAFYTNDESLGFNVKSTKDSYVNIFVFNEDEAYMLYPSEYEEISLMSADVEYTFPLTAADYVLFTKKESEVHRIIFVFTKEKIQYTGKISYKEISDWLFSIPPDMRTIKTFGFSVVKQNE